MAVIDVHILAQSILYFCVFTAGFCIAIPIGVNRINFNGQCMLYGSAKWDKTSFLITPSSAANCNFPIYVSVFCLIFYGLACGLYNMYAVIRSRKDPQIGTQMWVMPFILINTLLAVTTLIVACMISVGFMQFCKGITETGVYQHCSDAEKHEWKYVPKDTKFKTGPYFQLLTVAQVAAWSCLLAWILQIGLLALRFYRNRRLRSAHMMESAQGKETSDTAKISELEPTA